jgi:hypothetical protein
LNPGHPAHSLVFIIDNKKLKTDGSKVCSVFHIDIFEKKHKSVPVPKHHGMKMYKGIKVNLHTYLTWAQNGGQQSALYSVLLYPWEKKA